MSLEGNDLTIKDSERDAGGKRNRFRIYHIEDKYYLWRGPRHQLQSLHSNKKKRGKLGFAQAIWDQPIPTKTSSGSWKSNAPWCSWQWQTEGLSKKCAHPQNFPVSGSTPKQSSMQTWQRFLGQTIKHQTDNWPSMKIEWIQNEYQRPLKRMEDHERNQGEQDKDISRNESR